MVPDKEIGWGVPAFRAGLRMAERWRPDVVYASAPPFTGLLVARALSRRLGIPWVAGLRDLWSDNPYRSVRPGRLDRMLEARVLSDAAGIVVTTDEAADVIRARYPVPTVTVMNGYDPDDLRDRTPDQRPEPLRIVHTGVLVHDRRDPTALFEAMRSLRAEGRAVRAEFYGRDSAVAARAAARTRTGDLVGAHGSVSYQESLQVQRDADVLLLLQWNDPAERRICPAKLFEYAAARRPVVAIAPRDGVVARLLRGSSMGVVASSPDEIALELRRLADVKAATGDVPDVAPHPPEVLSRARQVGVLAEWLARGARRGTSRC
jgi:glycosyltransferase involved in cell wall biosynthesis